MLELVRFDLSYRSRSELVKSLQSEVGQETVVRGKQPVGSICMDFLFTATRTSAY